MGGDEALPPLREIIFKEVDKELSRAALFLVAEIEGAVSLAALKEVLRSSKDQELQKNALLALAEHGGAKMKEILLDTALNNPDEKFAESAAFALRDLEGRARLAPAPDKKVDVGEGRRAVLCPSPTKGRRIGRGPGPGPQGRDGPRDAASGRFRPRRDEK